ncbi:MAG: hypothetical protein LBD65_05580, partial [Spirochaetaceae bacterium]|nr:hypothetical protein [Spirochaetaceae bacterium]
MQKQSCFKGSIVLFLMALLVLFGCPNPTVGIFKGTTDNESDDKDGDDNPLTQAEKDAQTLYNGIVKSYDENTATLSGATVTLIKSITVPPSPPASMQMASPDGKAAVPLSIATTGGTTTLTIP